MDHPFQDSLLDMIHLALPMDGLLTMTELAKRWGCSREWVYYLIAKKRLKANKVGGIYILREKDVAACKVRPRAKPSSNGHNSTSPQKRSAKKLNKAKTKAGKPRTKQPQ